MSIFSPPVAVSNAAINAPLTERLAFIRKVYTLLTLSVISGIIASYMTISNIGFLSFVSANIWLFFILEIGALLFAMFAAKKETLALIALFLFTVLSGITASPIIHVYSSVVGQAATLTVLAFVSLTAFAIFSKKDFSFMGPFLMVGIIVLVVGGLLNAFFFQNSGMSFFMAIGSVVIFSGFILYDTSNIIRTYPTDQYICATLGMYLNILNLFLALLRILGSRD